MVAYIRTLATGCKQCHTQLDGHEIDPTKLFAGGRPFTTSFYDVRSANITPHDTGLTAASALPRPGRPCATAPSGTASATMRSDG